MIDIAQLQTACAANKEDAAELALAYNGRTAAMRAYNERPGKQTRDDYQAAKDLLDQVTDRLQHKYFPEEAPSPEGERFTNRLQALNWLQAQGYKVGQDKFYKDCKAGFPRIHRDKTISRFEVLQYGQQLDIKTKGTTDYSDLEARRIIAEVEKAEADRTKASIQAAQLERELDKTWIKREDAIDNECIVAALLRDAYVHRMNKAIPALIHAAGGKTEHIADVQAVLDQITTDACNDIAASGDVEVEIEE